MLGLEGWGEKVRMKKIGEKDEPVRRSGEEDQIKKSRQIPREIKHEEDRVA